MRYLYQTVEAPFAALASNTATRIMLNAMRAKEKQPICEWVESNVDLSFDQTSSASGLIHLYPYQREVLEACDDPRVTDVTFQAGQRLGKSQVWKAALLKHVADGGCIGLIMYPNEKLGKRTNQDTVEPLLKSLPDVAGDLAIKSNNLKDGYHIPSRNSIIYFLGGGSQAISYTANFAIMDEADFIELPNADAEDEMMSQVRALRLRMKTFKEKKFLVFSSATTFGGVVHQAWKKGSMGTWHLRCLGCGEYSSTNKLAFFVDGSKWAGLQWEKDDGGEIVPDSIRWICPVCGRAHIEAEAIEMNRQGKYIHQRNSAAHRSFQVGALAQPLFWRWAEIAQHQEDASSGDGDAKKYLANTVLGMPYKHVRDGDPSVTIEAQNEARKIDYPADLAARLAIVVAGIDRQSSDLQGRYFCSVVRGFCDDGSSYLLTAGYDGSMEEVKARISASYLGQPVRLAVIDNGGFTTQDTDPYVFALKNLWYYKGAGANQLGELEFAKAKEAKKMWVANAIKYQVRLLETLYTSGKPGWYLPHDVFPDYFTQLCNVRPGSGNMKDGRNTEFQNWCSTHDARRDFFDCEKMLLVALDVCCQYIPAQGFPLGHKPRFYVERMIRKIHQQKTGAK